MDSHLAALAEAARGFMPAAEGLALNEAALGLTVGGPMLEIGSYCGKSALYLGAAAQSLGRILFALDHHRGSEENQAGWEHHEPDLVDASIAKIDTLPHFRRTIHDAGLESTVVALVGDASAIGAVWDTPLALLFIDGGHGHEAAHRDYDIWVPKLAVGGRLLIHDVFADPTDGGRPPYEIFCRALDSGEFREVGHTGSLRVLERIAAPRSSRTSRPQRIPTVSDAAATEPQRKVLDPLRRPDGRVPNIFATMANHPDLARRWLVFGNHVLAKSTLAPRIRELAILRIGWLCGSDYEWGQHVLIARQVGISDDEIAQLKLDPSLVDWADSEACVILAADELHASQEISDSTWATLAEHYDQQQLMDLVFTVGQYTLVSMALNAFGVPRDQGIAGFDD